MSKNTKYSFPSECPHKPFFGCKNARNCIGCYYNPDKKVAMSCVDPNDEAPKIWFYKDKNHSARSLVELDKIRLGKGLKKGGTRCKFKFARVKDLEDE